MENQNQRVRVFCRLKPVTNEHQESESIIDNGIYSMKFLNYITALMIKNIRVPGVPEVQNTKRILDRRSFYQNKYVQQCVVERE